MAPENASDAQLSAFSNEASPTRPTQEAMHSAANAPENPSIAQLTDQQINLLPRLSTANVPVADLAGLMERMAAGTSSGRQGLGSSEISMDPETAPPSYDIIAS